MNQSKQKPYNPKTHDTRPIMECLYFDYVVESRKLNKKKKSRMTFEEENNEANLLI